MISTILIAFLINYVLLCTCEDDNLKVCVKNVGCLQGTYMAGYQSEKFEAFMGIPYAKPPIGDLRFQNPEPAEAWPDTILQATAFKDACMQKNYFFPSWPISGSEDCLYMNIYRPLTTAVNAKQKLPVMFYIHGGGFFMSSPDPKIYGPEYFMDTQAVILVTMGYRLGPFGFLSTGDENMSGNFALKDQLLALKWVNEHIADFGGDAELITIFGHNVGASSVQFHTFSAASAGLFQRAIMMGGNAFASYTKILEQPLDQALKIATACGLDNADNLSTLELASALRKIDAYTLIDAGKVLKDWHIYPFINFRPTLEKATWANAFITEHPEKQVRIGNYTQVPRLIGLAPSKGEGTVVAMNTWTNDELRSQFNANFDKLFLKVVEFPIELSEEQLSAAGSIIMDEYFPDRRVLDNDTINNLLEVLGDTMVHYPFYKSLVYYHKYANVEKNPVYLFKFNYQGPYSYTRLFSGGIDEYFGVAHWDDLFYLFRQSYLMPEDYDKSSLNAKLVKELVGTYVNFAINGKLDELASCTASNFDFEEPVEFCNYMEFANSDDDGFEKLVKTDFPVQRMNFWHKNMEQYTRT